MAQPDSLGLTHRSTVALQPDADAQTVLDAILPSDLSETERQALRALILNELRRLHQSVLARYGLRPSQLKAWQQALLAWF